MPPHPYSAWTRLTIDGWVLSCEASCVIWLRMARLMGGGALASREAERMVSEKMIAGMTLWPMLAAGGTNQSATQIGERTLRHYRKPVRANRRRLSR